MPNDFGKKLFRVKNSEYMSLEFRSELPQRLRQALVKVAAVAHF